MSNIAITDLVIVCAAVFGLAVFAWLVFVPAVTAYSRWWERVAAGVLSLYVLAACVGVGAAVGVAISVWVWPRVF